MSSKQKFLLGENKKSNFIIYNMINAGDSMLVGYVGEISQVRKICWATILPNPFVFSGMFVKDGWLDQPMDSYTKYVFPLNSLVAM